MNFIDKLLHASQKNRSLLCVGLDPDPSLMPEGIDILEFNRKIIDVTSHLVCAYKLNLAFYEALDDGYTILKQTVEHIPEEILSIGDGKRADIGNTSKAYARSIFEKLGFDASTVNPYLGFDSIEPFIRYTDKGVFILCRTSNAGAADFQSLPFKTESGFRHLYEIVAQKAEEWNTRGNIGLVVGATYPEELKLIRKDHPQMPILIPGIGAQGGDLELAVRYGADQKGQKALINSSRQVLYASKGKDFAQAARRVASNLRDRINLFLPHLST